MKCPICEVEFEPKRSDAKTCGKDACRKKLQRGGGSPKISPPIEDTESKKLKAVNDALDEAVDVPLNHVLPKDKWFNAFTPYEPVLDVYQPENGDVMCNGELLKGAYPKGTGTNLLANRYLHHFRYHKNSCNPISEIRKPIE